MSRIDEPESSGLTNWTSSIALGTPHPTGVAQRRPWPVGHFENRVVKPILPFLTTLYLRAQLVHQLARNVHVFHMQSIYIARQALHLVILLNNAVDANEGPSDEQDDERNDLEDELIELSKAMTEWGADKGDDFDYERQARKIEQQYAQLFKGRFYFRDVRDCSTDPLHQRLVAYDAKTIRYRQHQETPASMPLNSPPTTPKITMISFSSPPTPGTLPHLRPNHWGLANYPILSTNSSTPQQPLRRQERSSVMEEEPANDYCINGGYLRVNIGDKLGPEGRYEVKRKLGWGGFSTVWLALDSRDNKHVAIKICRSDRETTDAAIAELHVLREAMWQGQFHDNIAGLVDSFVVPAVLNEPWTPTDDELERPVHHCIVVEVLGPNLLTVLEAHQLHVRSNSVDAVPGQAGGLPLPLVKEFSKQLLAATAYLHDYIRHIHTDLKLENIVLAIPDIQKIIERDLLSTPEPSRILVETTTPEKEETETEVVQIYQSQPLTIPIYRLSSLSNSIDGNSFETTTPPSGSTTTADRHSYLDTVTTQSVSSTACGSLVSTSTAPSTSLTSISISTDPISIASIGIPSFIDAFSFATPSSPREATFTNFSRRLSNSFNSLSHFFVRSPPTKEPSAIAEMKQVEEVVFIEEENVQPPPRERERERARRSKVFPNLDIKLVDFGNAQPFSDRCSQRIQTRQYRAPEIILGKRDWDKKADMWSVACIIFELVTGDYLFDPPEDARNRDRAHIYQILELTNPFYDRRWAMSGRQSSRIFNTDGNPFRRLKYRSLQQLFEQKYRLETTEAKGLAEFLLPMLAFEPCKRPNAKDLEHHPWLTGTRPTRPFPPNYGGPGFDFIPSEDVD